MKKLEINKYNYIVFVVAIVFLIGGYLIMATGDHIVSPILLVISYLFLFPLSIVIGAWIKKNRK